MRHYAPDEIFHVRAPSDLPIYSRWNGTVSDFARLSERRRARFRCVLGHFQFGIHEHVPRPSRYVTLLRDPVTRVLSKHRQQVREDTVRAYTAREDIATLEEFLHAHPTICHEQTSMLAPVPPSEAVREDSAGRAIRNLSAHFAVVGTLDRFDEFVLVAAKELGWSDVCYTPLNVTSGYGKQASPDVLADIERSTALDLALFRHASRLLDEAIARYGPPFAADLERFRADNRALRRRQSWVARALGRPPRRDPMVRRTGANEACVEKKPRVLVEASKLTHPGTDGIKRYVAELLRSYREDGTVERFDIDVLIDSEVFPLELLPAEYLSQSSAGNALPDGGSRKHRILQSVGILVPPIILPAIKSIVPDEVSRRVLGKPKAELRTPSLDRPAAALAKLLVPPKLVSVLRTLASRRIVGALWVHGLFHMHTVVDTSEYDLVHLTLPNNFVGHGDAALLVTVHDLSHLACPEYQTRANRITLKVGLESAIERGARFVCVSDATRMQLIEAYALDPSRMSTVHNGCDEAFEVVTDPARCAAVRTKYGISSGRFLLTLSTLEPRKNLAGVIEAFDLLVREGGYADVTLVLAGAQGWKVASILEAASRRPRRVVLTGPIEDGDLAALYSSAVGLVYASHYEGFGLPLLEAMGCGCPVIYGNNSSMPEVVGDAGLAADARDVTDIARQMRRLLDDEALVRELRSRAVTRAREFSWNRAAEETARAYALCTGEAEQRRATTTRSFRSSSR